MSLPDLLKANENYGTYQIWNVAIVDDGYGGYKDEWTAGASFEGVLVLDDSINAQIAEQQGVKGLYTLTFEKALHLPWHTVFNKKGTNAFYRVTSRDENATPSSTKLNMRYVKAEEYEIPNGGVTNG